MNNLAQRDTLLYLTMGIVAWSISQLSICWWQGLIGAGVAALLVILRYQMKLGDIDFEEDTDLEEEPKA